LRFTLFSRPATLERAEEIEYAFLDIEVTETYFAFPILVRLGTRKNHLSILNQIVIGGSLEEAEEVEECNKGHYSDVYRTILVRS
jgi:rubrerythrin